MFEILTLRVIAGAHHGLLVIGTLNVKNKNDDLAIYYESLMRSPRTKALQTIEIVKATRNNLKDNVQVTRARLKIDN